MLKTTLILLLLICTPLQAAVHRWVDENGNVHYSDRAPAKQKTQQITIQPRSAPDPATLERLRRQGEGVASAQTSRQEQKEQRVAEEKSDNQAKARCKSAKERLKTLETVGRIFTYDDNLERTFIDDKQRKERLKSARENIKQQCK